MSYRRIRYKFWLILIIFVLVGCKKSIQDRFETHYPAFIPADMRVLTDEKFKPGLSLKEINRSRLLSAQSEQTSLYLEYYEASPKQAVTLAQKNLALEDPDWKVYPSGAKSLCRDRSFDGVDFEECYLYFNDANFYLFGSIVEHPQISLKPETLLPSLFSSK